MNNLITQMAEAIGKLARPTCDYDHLPSLANPEECAQAALSCVMKELEPVREALILNADPRNSSNECISAARQALQILDGLEKV